VRAFVRCRMRKHVMCGWHSIVTVVELETKVCAESDAVGGRVIIGGTAYRGYARMCTSGTTRRRSVMHPS
jgi:hypothetical protein